MAAVNITPLALADDYAAVLGDYLAAQTEECLHQVYELGRRALTAGCGTLAIAGVHDQAMSIVLAKVRRTARRDELVRLGHAVFLEALSPFEMSQRQCRDASAALRRLNETLEGELRRIAYALHDEAAQLLVSVDLAVDEVGVGLPPAARARLDRIRTPLRQCAGELRRLSHELRPPILDDLGLVPALEYLASSMSSRLGIPIAVTGSTEARPAGAIEVAVYRIVQEALVNIGKHAHASNVAVDIRQADATLHCAVRDDGDGFDALTPRHADTDAGLGLTMIRERLEALGGTHHFVTTPGQGTALLLTIPI